MGCDVGRWPVLYNAVILSLSVQGCGPPQPDQSPTKDDTVASFATDDSSSDSDTPPTDTNEWAPNSLPCEPGARARHARLGVLTCVEAGTFTMGCVEGRDANVDWCAGVPSRTVTLTRNFWMMTAEVTQAQYGALMGANPSTQRSEFEDLPVDSVTRADAIAFANAVSAAEGAAACAGGDPYACAGWRLPTDAEWEYAARAHTDWPFAGGDEITRVGWTQANASGSCRETTPAGPCSQPACGLARNAFGLCDMTGNVWEWVYDDWSDYVRTDEVDPIGGRRDREFTARGASWGSYEVETGLWTRLATKRTWKDSRLGFRLVRSLP